MACRSGNLACLRSEDAGEAVEDPAEAQSQDDSYSAVSRALCLGGINTYKRNVMLMRSFQPLFLAR